LAAVELDIRLLVDHRERLVRTRVALNGTLQWNLPARLDAQQQPTPSRCPRT
jgi:hypothetical protein